MKRIISFIVLVALTFCSVSVISVSAAGSAPSISVEETVLPSGSSITVDYDNISNVADDVRVSIYYVGDTLDGWWDPTSECHLENESGTLVFPRDDELGKEGYQDGKYNVVLFHDGRTQLDSVVVTIGDAPDISVQKTEFGKNEDIKISYKNISSELGKNLEIRLYNPSDRVGLVSAKASVALTDAESALLQGASGTLVLAEGGTIEPGEYEIRLISGAGLSNILDEIIPITVTDEIVQSAPSISVEETELPSGSSITVNYDNISNVGDDVRVSIYYVGDTLDGWWDPTSECHLENESGTLVFPRDDELGKEGYQDGKYNVVLFHNGRTKLGNVVVTIGDAPEISVQKTEFGKNEDIKISYKNISSELGKDLEIRLYNPSDRVGLVVAKASVALTDAECGLLHGESGTLVLAEGETIEPGEYEIRLVSGAGLSNILDEIITITITDEIVQEDNVQTGDAVMSGLVVMILLAGACTVVLKRCVKKETV